MRAKQGAGKGSLAWHGAGAATAKPARFWPTRGRHLPGGLILSALLAACRFVPLLSRPFGRPNLPATDLPLTFRIRCTAGVGPAQALLSFQSMATSGLAMNMDE